LTALIRFSECLAAQTRQHSLAVFALGPGTVRTALSEFSLNSPEGQRWLPWFRRIFEEGLELPPEPAAQRLLALAAGRMDALSGRFFPPSDDLGAIRARIGEVERAKPYSPRSAISAPVFAAIAAAAERG